MDSAERLALTALCAELPELRDECELQPEPARTLLAQVEERARARLPILPLLGELLDADTVRSLATSLPGTGPGHADEERFTCPDGACDHVRITAPAGPIPVCPVTMLPMKRG
jgi:hypothetical protein